MCQVKGSIKSKILKQNNFILQQIWTEPSYKQPRKKTDGKWSSK